MLLKFVKKVRSKGRDYYYFDTGKAVAGKKVYARLPDIRAPEFGNTYETMLGHRNRKTPDTGVRVPELIDLYQRSSAYRALSKNSMKVYDIYLRRLETLMPTAPVALIEAADFLRLFDKMADTPGAANMFLAVSSAMFKWAMPRGYIRQNPCENIKPLALKEHQPWPIDLVEAGLAAKDARVRLLTNLLYYTAQRLNDVLDMKWSDIAGDTIQVRQEKTKKVLTIPLHSALRAELAKTKRSGLLIVMGARGRRMFEDAARKYLQDFAAERGHKIVPHGLRKNAVNALLEVGCSVAETAAISGQSLQMVEHYAKQRDQAKLASAAILRWERNESETFKQGKTA